MTLGTHAVKVKTVDSKRWNFLTSGGGLTHLRIHAALASEERCKAFAADLLESNPGVVEATKVVAFWKD